MLSDKNKPRLTLLVILLVFVSITVYSLGVESKEKITVDEGYDELSLNYISDESIGKTFFNETTDEWYKNATSKTYVDRNNILKLNIIVNSITSDDAYQYVTVHMKVLGDFTQDYNLERLLLKIKGLDGDDSSHYSYDFKTSFLKKKNLIKWNPNDNVAGTIGTKKSYIGFDVKQNYFSTEVQFQWMIPRKYLGNNYTIRTNANLSGSLIDADSTIDLNIKGGI